TGVMITEFTITRMALPLFIWNFYLVFLYQSAISEEHFMFVSGNKTKEGMVSGVNTVAQRTTDQANIVGETAVGSTNEVGQKTVEGLENVAATTGLVNPVSDLFTNLLVGGGGGHSTSAQNWEGSRCLFV
uniref:Gamma-synuclein n=1 Tax=Sinocyclocheilus rhinocerous TaxID=307959 RepID=A0A673LQU4_9TELE